MTDQTITPAQGVRFVFCDGAHDKAARWWVADVAPGAADPVRVSPACDACALGLLELDGPGRRVRRRRIEDCDRDEWAGEIREAIARGAQRSIFDPAPEHHAPARRELVAPGSAQAPAGRTFEAPPTRRLRSGIPPTAPAGAECDSGLWLRPHYGDGAAPVAADPVYIPCKRWACESCGRKRRAEVLKHLRRGVIPDQIVRLLTVTFPADVAASLTGEGVAGVNERMRRFVQALRRQHGAFEYAKTLEVTKRGRLHVHALTRGGFLPKCNDRGRRRHGLPTGAGSGSPCYCAGSPVFCPLPKCPDARAHRHRCIQAIAWEMGLGFVDIRKVRNPEHAAAYVSKYLAKACGEDRWPRYARRYSASRRWAPVTLGQIHADYVAGLRARGVIPEPDPRLIVWWERCEPPPIRSAEARRPLDPALVVDVRTGEIIAR